MVSREGVEDLNGRAVVVRAGDGDEAPVEGDLALQASGADNLRDPGAAEDLLAGLGAEDKQLGCRGAGLVAGDGGDVTGITRGVESVYEYK